MTGMEILILLGAGGSGGFFVGRWWSEFSRGRFEARKAWDNRNAYRS